MSADDHDGVVREALRKHSRLRILTIEDDQYLANDLGFDSFALLQVVLELEDLLGIEVEADKLAGLRDMTFRRFADLVRSHVDASRIPAARGAAP